MNAERKYTQSPSQRKIARHICMASLLLAGSLTSAQALSMTDRYVNYDAGVDTPGCDVVTAPCKTIGFTIDQTDPGDTIYLNSLVAAPVTYFESQLAIPHDLTIIGQGTGRSIIDAQNMSYVIKIDADQVVLRNLTIRNGEAGSGVGGGIHLAGGNLVVIGSKIINNDALAGGGIAALDTAGHVRLYSSTISGNGSSAGGGGIWCDGCSSVRVVRGQILKNVAGSTGGGIHIVNSAATIVRSKLNDNNADTGGALFTLDGVTKISSSELSGNVADSSNGGAVLVSGDLNVHWTTMNKNRSELLGGAIFATDNSALKVSNSTLSNNTAEIAGGAIGLGDGTFGAALVVLGASTLYNNESASTLPGGGNHIFGSLGLFQMNNTIVTNDPNATAAAGPVCNMGVSSGEHNMIDDNTCNGPSASFNIGVVNGLDSNLEFNGGSTRTHQLLSGSNAIDAGLNASCFNPSTGNPLIFDQRFRPRPVDGDSNGSIICDVGAYERQ